jgi:GDPmannose 4,6-dehydratase
MKRALITGITGQDGSYLAELLLSKGYEVHGLIRLASTSNTHRIEHISQDPHSGAHLVLHNGDLGNPGELANLLGVVQPDEVYHLAAQSHVKVSFEMPEYTGDITGLGTTRMLEAIRRSGIQTRFYQASTSEMFGNSPAPQNEDTPFRPRSPYAAAKVYAHWMLVTYRESYGLFAASGILFNHESPRRGETFVTRKITRALASILAGKSHRLSLGNLDASRDWGYAPDYVEAMWLMLQQDRPQDYVIGTGETHSVRDFLDEAFGYVGRDWRDHVTTDPQYMRPLEVPMLVADSAKAKKALGWQPRISFKELVRVMVDFDMAAIGLQPPGEGRKALEQKDFGWDRWDTGILAAQRSAPKDVG